MGLSLSEPITTKTTDAQENEQYKVGVSCMQGWRIEMEDAHTIEIDYIEDDKSCFLAVFDGHGGTKVAKYSASNLYKVFPNLDTFSKGDYHAALKKSFLDTDVNMLADDDMRDDSSGATAVVVYIKNNKLYCANAGDSRAILSKSGTVFELSHDHKPNNTTEHQRINKAGGYVEFNRVNGNLALSRALGDFTYKHNDALVAEEQIVTADPDIIEKELSSDDEFIVLACDGIWDCMTNEEVLDFVRTRLAEGIQPHVICEKIMDFCLAPEVKPGGVGCDNMSVIITCLLNGKTFEEFCAKLSSSSNINLDKEQTEPVNHTAENQVENGEETPSTSQTEEKEELKDLTFIPHKSPIDIADELSSPVTVVKEAEIQSLLNGNL
ncbi:protein phosphatase 2C T23F11.1-like [Oopsacas minuta]|uniref:protein-serine/threonine phosphatase n=1 Tax=Oopsacas minuta TaxID=111878 RepID=A0AAV7JF85_9METZ|nr:protein phosphatase 2C T23F11.1-like [Oopsacas minuta]